MKDAQRWISCLNPQSILEQMPGGFFVYLAGEGEKLLYANQAMIRMVGCSTLEEMRSYTGNSFRGIVHPDDYQQTNARIWEQIRSSQYGQDYVEYRIIGKDGEVRWVEDYGHFVRSEELGDLFYVFAADATDKRRQQMAERTAMLETANQELRRRLNIIEGFSVDYESIFYADLDINLVQPYQVSSRVTGLMHLGDSMPFAGFDAEYIKTWVHPDDRDMLRQATSPAYIRGRLQDMRSYRLTYRIVEKGRPTYLQLQVADVSRGIQRGGQIVLGYRKVDDDIRRELERRELLETALSRARAAADAKTAFLSNMSHDIRTPMNTVVGYTSLARKNLESPEKLLNCLDQIDAASTQMLRLINNVLDLSRMENGTMQVSAGLCSLPELVDRVRNEALPLAREKGVEIILDLAGIRHPLVQTDQHKLAMLLSHLVSNGVKYNRPDGTVTITVTERGAANQDFAAYSFEVRDTGIGIEPEYLARIFEPFERLRDTTHSGVPGMGLGLTIVKSMAELMGGTVSAQSREGEGSVFTLRLSLPIQEQETAPAEPRTRTGDTPGQRILLVEDNELNRELCAELLSDAGFLVDTAENGQVAVDMVRRSQPNYYTLILMDIQMPVMDGNEAARTIRALPDPALSSIPIIALSANALEEDRKRSMESGMDAHLSKPFRIEALLEYLDTFIGST